MFIHVAASEQRTLARGPRAPARRFNEPLSLHGTIADDATRAASFVAKAIQSKSSRNEQLSGGSRFRRPSSFLFEWKEGNNALSLTQCRPHEAPNAIGSDEWCLPIYYGARKDHNFAHTSIQKLFVLSIVIGLVFCLKPFSTLAIFLMVRDKRAPLFIN